MRSPIRPRHRAGRRSRRWWGLVAVMAVALATLGMPGMSGATFTSTSNNTVSTVTAAADWTPPTVSMVSPASAVNGTITVTANASDGQSGVASVAIQYLAPNASSWATLCTATASPYSCSWNTAAGADGSYSLRAIATDNAGYVTVSDTVSTTVANSLLVTLNNPGDYAAGTVSLTANLYNTGGLPYVVTIQYAVSGTTGWNTLCVVTTAPYTCGWNTTLKAYAQGQSYDLRAVATVAASTATSATVSGVLVDNVAPTVTMTDPGSPLAGTATFAATASDADAGVATVQLQYELSGTSTWTTFCTMQLTPYSCRYSTTQLTSGVYSFRAVATDAAGNVATSSVVAARTIDNSVDSISMEDPGAFLNGTVTLLATANSTAGVKSVEIDRAPAGSTTWTPVCTVTTSPYSCSLDTTKLADGFYDFRAILTSNLGRTTTSTTMASRRVDNSPLRGYNVQAISGGAIAGRLDTGDSLKLTYSSQVSLGSITSGWTGASLAVSLRLRDGGLLGLSGGDDTVDVLIGGTAINLGSVDLRGNYIKGSKTAVFNGTMVASTTTVNGVTATVITVTVGAIASGSGLRTGSPVNPVWTPSTSATDVYGHACSGAPVTALGTAVRAF
ncbi:MAG: Ig-like domain-containing protein [Marmoricola sp.]